MKYTTSGWNIGQSCSLKQVDNRFKWYIYRAHRDFNAITKMVIVCASSGKKFIFFSYRLQFTHSYLIIISIVRLQSDQAC